MASLLFVFIIFVGARIVVWCVLLEAFYTVSNSFAYVDFFTEAFGFTLFDGGSLRLISSIIVR